MSFVYAVKDSIKISDVNYYKIDVFSDTKITFGKYGNIIWDKEKFKLIEKYGLIKCMIVSEKCCVSFAGNDIFRANELLTSIYKDRNVDPQSIIKKAYTIHCSCLDKNDIEFIVCFCDKYEQLHITCIKDGECYADVDSAYIGSSSSYKVMQHKRLLYNTKSINTIFDEVLNSTIDDSVGGFTIQASYSPFDKTFSYPQIYKTYYEKKQVVKPGQSVIVYGDASEGGYSLCYSKNQNELMIYVYQGQFSINYKMDLKSTNDKIKYFLLPNILL